MHFVVRLEIVDESALVIYQATLAWIILVIAILFPTSALKIEAQSPFDATHEFRADLAEVLCAAECLCVMLALGMCRLGSGGAIVALFLGDSFDDSRSGSIAEVLEVYGETVIQPAFQHGGRSSQRLPGMPRMKLSLRIWKNSLSTFGTPRCHLTLRS